MQRMQIKIHWIDNLMYIVWVRNLEEMKANQITQLKTNGEVIKFIVEMHLNGILSAQSSKIFNKIENLFRFIAGIRKRKFFYIHSECYGIII